MIKILDPKYDNMVMKLIKFEVCKLVKIKAIPNKNKTTKFVELRALCTHIAIKQFDIHNTIIAKSFDCKLCNTYSMVKICDNLLFSDNLFKENYEYIVNLIKKLLI